MLANRGAVISGGAAARHLCKEEYRRIVVKETDKPGQFAVIDSWKGDLPHGATIDLPT